jgi:hypothetical protein
MTAFEARFGVVKHFNPFRPGSIITPGMFCGRLDELSIVERILFQTKHGNSGHFLIHGERGIGKSSLLLYLQYVATGSITTIDNQEYRFLVLPLELEPSTTYTTLIRKVGAEFQRQLASQQRFKDRLAGAWEFLKRWEVMGVKYNEAGIDPDALLDDLVHTVHTALVELTGKLDGVLVLIDESDKPSATVANLGTFAKLFTERLSKRGCNNVALGLAGLTILSDRLRESHESAPRLFQYVTLFPLQPDERIEVVRKGLAEIKAKFNVDVTITGEAESYIASMSEGYPHFIQQFAYSAVEFDQDNYYR